MALPVMLPLGIALPAAYVAVLVLDLRVLGLSNVCILEEGLKAAVMFAMWRGRRWTQIKLTEH